MAEQDKWEKLKQWVAKRHDYFEREYTQSQVAVDEVEAAAYRKVFEAMLSFEVVEYREKSAESQKPRPTRAGK